MNHPGPGMSLPDGIADLTAASFEDQVVRASSAVPVLVDFWADWCQPCKMLAPLLEQLAQEHQGRLRIARVNTDAEPELAMQYGIRTLPTVKLFRDGTVANEFSGVQPLAAIEAFVQPYLPRESDALLARALEHAARGDTDGAVELLEQALDGDAENYRIHPVLVQCYIGQRRFADAEQLIRTLPVNQQQDEVIVKLQARLKVEQLGERGADVESLLSRLADQPDDPDLRFELSAAHAADGDYEQALQQLLEIIRIDRGYRDGAARAAMVDIFNVLNNQGPLVKKYRSLLAAALN